MLYFFKRNRVNKRFDKISDKKQAEAIKNSLFSDHNAGDEREGQNPLICGSFTGWETVMMQRVQYTAFKKTKEYKAFITEIATMANDLIKAGKID